MHDTLERSLVCEISTKPTFCSLISEDKTFHGDHAGGYTFIFGLLFSSLWIVKGPSQQNLYFHWPMMA